MKIKVDNYLSRALIAIPIALLNVYIIEINQKAVVKSDTIKVSTMQLATKNLKLAKEELGPNSNSESRYL